MAAGRPAHEGGIEIAETRERYIVDEEGRKTAVVLPLEEYQELVDDLHDLAVIAERRDEPAVALEEVKKRLQKKGSLQSPMEEII